MDRQQAAKEEMQNRQYLYGGLRPITGPFVGERREILSPEMNINMGPTLGGGYNIQTIPAEYGPVEYDSSYAPVNRGLSALNDLFFGDANEQAAVVNQAGSALKNVLTSMPEYFSDQVTAVASGGEYFDPDTNQITQFDPTILLAGGNPAASGGITLGSGIKFSGPKIQTAEAGKIIETPPRDFKNEKGYSTSPLMGATDLESRPENIAAGSYRGLVNKYQTNQDYRTQEQDRLIGGRYTQPENLFMQSGTYEDLLGKPLVILPADKTIYGKIDRVAGVDIDPVLSEGGPQHLDRYGNWMSMRGAAKTKQAHINRVREETQQDPVLMYTAMANEGSNFSVPPSNIAVNMIKAQGDLTRDQANMLDTAIANLNQKTQDFKGIPQSWDGYESPEQLLNWLTTDSPTASAGNKRKAFMGDQILNKPAFKTAGFPIPNDIYSVVNEQDMLNMKKGMSGSRAMIATDAEPSDLVFDTTMNSSYNTIIPSSGGVLIKEPMVPYDVMYPDPIAARAQKNDAYRSFQTSGGAQDYQMANEQWLEGLYQNLKSRGLK